MRCGSREWSRGSAGLTGRPARRKPTMPEAMQVDTRPWRVYKSPKRVRVVKRDLFAVGHGRKNEVFVCELPASLGHHEAKQLALGKPDPQVGGPIVEQYVEQRPWVGYWHPVKGARCRRGGMRPDERGEDWDLIGTFDASMVEAAVLDAIRAKKGFRPVKKGARKR